jgi:hypothetical protein
MPPRRVCQSGKARQVQPTTGHLSPGASALPLNASRYGPTDWGNRCDAAMSVRVKTRIGLFRLMSALVWGAADIWVGACTPRSRCDGTGTSRNKDKQVTAAMATNVRHGHRQECLDFADGHGAILH